MYCQVVFLQNPDELEEAESILYGERGWVSAESIDATARYLSSWDYGAENEYDDALAQSIEKHPGDDVYPSSEGTYTIVARRGLYISLWREASC